MSLREKLLATAAEKKPAREPVKFMGEDIFVKEMNGAERDAYEAYQVEQDKEGQALKNFRSRLLVRVLVDSEGNRVFQDDDAEKVGTCPAREIAAAYDIASQLNALGQEDAKDLGKK